MKDLSTTQKRCLELARIIREGLEGVEFDMREWGECGTVGCIAGYACVVYDKPTWLLRNSVRTFRSAKKLLGLSWWQSLQLFCLVGRGRKLRNITPATAAAVLEGYALTGEVKWT